jgi:hypothetical protein
MNHPTRRRFSKTSPAAGIGTVAAAGDRWANRFLAGERVAGYKVEELG